ncbi:MAG TPA: 3-methyl-2-oxobutanoate hydroxymethyltransferase [Casimicrobiaceae bacterium]|jgi:3-methyl-2-oxobutanoate hydroxymethyltransferase|nr:3-methyl-2-oxobutanoate hydroxymethyltransferase [Casimicrobiaceae bacterium]
MTPTTAKRTVPGLAAMARQGDKIAMLTCYDASFAVVLERAGVDALLIGDSLGMVIGGHASTLPVTLDEMVYHTRCVAAGAKSALVIADMSFGSYQVSPEQAYANAARLMAAGAQMVKVEGGAWVAPTVEFLVARGIPVCGHLGLQPQSVHRLGGYKTQGKTEASAQSLRDDTRALALSGLDLLVLEMVPAALAAAITAEFTVPTIGIGAGPGCSGQVLVLYDMLGVYPGKPARFVRNFMAGSDSVEAAVAGYVRAVKDGSFPGPEHCV